MIQERKFLTSSILYLVRNTKNCFIEVILNQMQLKNVQSRLIVSVLSGE